MVPALVVWTLIFKYTLFVTKRFVPISPPIEVISLHSEVTSLISDVRSLKF
jgi:hypothetical protein